MGWQITSFTRRVAASDGSALELLLFISSVEYVLDKFDVMVQKTPSKTCCWALPSDHPANGYLSHSKRRRWKYCDGVEKEVKRSSSGTHRQMIIFKYILLNLQQLNIKGIRNSEIWSLSALTNRQRRKCGGQWELSEKCSSDRAIR